MNEVKRKSLEAKGWKLGDATAFLHLSKEEAAFIEMKLSLGRALRLRRKRQGLSQMEFARRIKSSQSRVAKMEGGDASVSVDLMIKSLLALGMSRQEVAKYIK